MKLLMEETGQGMAEYALILAGVALGVIAALNLLGGGIQNFFTNFLTQINALI